MTKKKKPWWKFWQKSDQSDPSEEAELGQASNWKFWQKDPDKKHTKEMKAVTLRRMKEEEETKLTIQAPTNATREISAPKRPKVKQPLAPHPSKPHPLATPIKKEIEQTKPEKQSKKKPKKKKAGSIRVEFQLQGTSVLFWLIFLLLLILFSAPIWLHDWLPMQDFPARLGLAAAMKAKQAQLSSFFSWQWGNYAGSGPSYLLAFFHQLLSPTLTTKILLQSYILFTPLAFLFSLQLIGRSRWSALLAFLFLYNGAFFQGDIEFMLATPLFLIGFGALYSWMAKNQGVAGLTVMVICILLLFIDVSAYVLFLFSTFIATFAFSKGWRDRVSFLLLPATSMLLFLPWLAIVRFANGSSAKTPSLFATGTIQHRFTDFIQIFGNLQSSEVNYWMLLGTLFLIACGLISQSNFYAQRKESHSSPHFFTALSVSLFLLYFLLPSHLLFQKLSAAPIAIMAVWLLLMWTHIQTGRMAQYSLLVGVILWGFFTGFTVNQQFAQHAKETKPIRELLRKVPKHKNLLIWKVGKTKLFRQTLGQVGGYHIYSKKGLSNIQLDKLRWNPVQIHPRRRLPRTNAKHMTGLKIWDYVITKHKLSNHRFTLFALRGHYRLYKFSKAR